MAHHLLTVTTKG